MDSLREAMYELIETRDVGEIKVVDLIRKAGVLNRTSKNGQ